MTNSHSMTADSPDVAEHRPGDRDGDPGGSSTVGSPTRHLVGDLARSLRRALSRLEPVLLVVVTLAAWELLARAGILGTGVPSLSGSLRDVVANASDYWMHARSTLVVAAEGLVIGGTIGVGGASIFVLSSFTERALRGVLLVTYCAPPIILVPVLAATFSLQTTKIVLVSLMVAYPMLVSVLIGLRGIERRSVDLIHAYGGGSVHVFWRVRVPYAFPSFLSGLQVAIPACLLGAMLADLAGGRWGLGLYLISGLKSGNRELVWGVTVFMTVLSAAGFVVFGWLSHRVRARRGQPEAPLALDLDAVDGASPGDSWRRRVAGVALGVSVPVLAWWLFVEVFGRSPIVAKGPFAVGQLLFFDDGAAARRSTILTALGETLLNTGLGFVCGLGAALLLAMVFEVWPRFRPTLMPAALITQTVPLAALVPILIVSVGRGTLTMVLIGVSITFFPSFLLISHGLADVPTTLVEVTLAAGGSPLTVLRKVKLPSAIVHLTAAARLLAPRALLGVILAEYVATGHGFGYLVYRARGSLDYAMMWATSVVAVVVSVGIYWLAGIAERAVMRSFAGGHR